MSASDLNPRQSGPESEGWTDFNGQSRKFHFIPADDKRALCGRWGLSPFVDGARELARLHPETGPGPDDCAACRRKLDARKAGGSR